MRSSLQVVAQNKVVLEVSKPQEEWCFEMHEEVPVLLLSAGALAPKTLQCPSERPKQAIVSNSNSQQPAMPLPHVACRTLDAACRVPPATCHMSHAAWRAPRHIELHFTPVT